MSPRNDVVLAGERLTKYFGGSPALKDVSFRVEQGEILGLIGPNGAGKTTLLNVISGILTPSAGRVLFQDRDITGMRPHAIARLGVARVLQTPRPFLSMTVLENVEVGALFGGRDRRGKTSTAVDQAEFALRLMGLHDKRNHPVGSLNLQEKKMVELARALAMGPEVTLIDEAMSGLNPAEIEDSMRLIQRVRDELKVTIVWVEHVMKAIMGAAERVMVLNYGQVIAGGSPGEVARDEGVIEAYLGRGRGEC
ncbi:MAG: ABC transporter ATP-binding protein [Deltaproteobacteria bacterium]|nr:ABC transporter ATP-binding protein [Deltaproteobacteria bacterium]